MFPEHSFYLVGRYAVGWKEIFPWHPDFTAKVEYSEERVEDLQFSSDHFDLMLDVPETNDYIPKYFETAKNWDLPRVRKILYTSPSGVIKRLGKWVTSRDDKTLKYLKYLKRFRRFPLVYENWLLQKRWEHYRVGDGRMILNTAEPWLRQNWKGDIGGILNVCNGAFSWREQSDEVKIAKQTLKEVKGQNYLHDAYEKWLWPKDYIEMMSHYRAYLETSTSRTLTMAFQQAMSLGMPVVAYDSRRTCYAQVIRHGVNGFITRNVRELKRYCEMLLRDYDLAKRIGDAAKETAKELWGFDVIKPKWEEAFKEAIKSWGER